MTCAIRWPLRAWILIAFSIAAVTMTACGHSNSTDPVAQVDGHSVSKQELERWTAIESRLAFGANASTPAPPGVVPDPPSYSKCAAFLRAHHRPGEDLLKTTTSELKARCATNRRSTQLHILDILLFSYWLEGEAAEKHVQLKPAEINTLLHSVAPTPAALRAYLANTGERLADLRLVVRKDLFDTKLEALEESALKKDNPSIPPEQILQRLASEFTTKWAARTTCSAAYLVSECTQYKGTRSLLAP
jgi:hypothetical protein